MRRQNKRSINEREELAENTSNNTNVGNINKV